MHISGIQVAVNCAVTCSLVDVSDALSLFRITKKRFWVRKDTMEETIKVTEGIEGLIKSKEDKLLALGAETKFVRAELRKYRRAAKYLQKSVSEQ